MGVCGAFVYIAADTTSATNIGLIYAASPILIVALARVFYGERVTLRQGLGILLSLAGVLAIVARGDPGVLTGLRFASGDLWAAAAMAAWAVYSILLRHRPSRSEEHTSELQSLMRISYAVFCLKKKKKTQQQANTIIEDN